MSSPTPSFEKIVNLLQQGNAVVAEQEALQCVQLFPKSAHGWFLLGVARHQSHRHADALHAFDRALALDPEHLQALQAQAAIFFETGRLQESLAICERVVALSPHDASALANLGTALLKLGRLDEALHHFDRALARDPKHANAWLNRGAVLTRLERPEEALTNNLALLAAHPRWPEAWFNLADAQLVLHRYEEALESCDKGIAIDPRHAGLHLKRGIALTCLAQFQRAQEALAAARALAPGILSQVLPDEARNLTPAEREHCMQPSYLATSLFLAAHLKAQEDCEWSRREAFLEKLTQFLAGKTPHGDPLHDMRLAQPLLSMQLPPAVKLQAVRQISSHVEENVRNRGLLPFTHAKRSPARLRIGYVSPDFRTHSVGNLSKPLYRLHDRTRFEVHCYSLRDAPEDKTQQAIAATCDHWVNLSSADTATAAQRIYADGIDILIDLAGHTRDAGLELFALRPAPVQVHYLGYPGTLGASFLDYIVADETVCPVEYLPFVAEQAILLDGTYCPFDTETPLSPLTLTRREAGLPENGIVFCCFNAAYKIEPTIFGIWLQLLRQIPGSVLWLVHQRPIERSNLLRAAECAGIASDRLVFSHYMSRERYLSSFRLADLFLDTRWHNAHTIAADALWQGLPVLTCTGPHWSSRLGASLLRAVGLPELITHTLEEYEALALALASDPARLAEIRGKLIASRRSAPLFSPEKTVRNLEQAYETMWRRWLEHSGAGR
jgi:protein O-GlcNAc transferase